MNSFMCMSIQLYVSSPHLHSDSLCYTSPSSANTFQHPLLLRSLRSSLCSFHGFSLLLSSNPMSVFPTFLWISCFFVSLLDICFPDQTLSFSQAALTSFGLTYTCKVTFHSAWYPHTVWVLAYMWFWYYCFDLSLLCLCICASQLSGPFVTWSWPLGIIFNLVVHMILYTTTLSGLSLERKRTI